MTKTYYVVHKGRNPGIYNSWKDCQKQIDKYEGAIFKKFSDENEAKTFLENGFGNNKKPRIVTRRENDDKKNNNKIEEEIDNDPSQKIFIYTDGSCIKLKNSINKGGYGIYIPSRSIMVGHPLLNQKITNNRAELTAIIESIKYLDEDELQNNKLCIFTDSQYSMYIFNGTGERYEANNYKNDGKDVPNIDLIKKILELKRKHNIVLLKVRAHTDKKDEHSKGNEIADKLANDGANNLQQIHGGLVSKMKLLEPGTCEGFQQNNFFKSNYGNDCESLSNDCESPIRNFYNESANNPKKMEDNIADLFEISTINSDEHIITSKKNTQNKKKIKNTKLSQWFIKN
jgi:ribonuclease HI